MDLITQYSSCLIPAIHGDVKKPGICKSYVTDTEGEEIEGGDRFFPGITPQVDMNFHDPAFVVPAHFHSSVILFAGILKN